MTNRAILLVPGMRKRERFEIRDKFITFLMGIVESYKIFEVGEGDFPEDARRIEVKAIEDGRTLTITVFEAYWGDLLPDRSNESQWQRFLRATRLVAYWMMSAKSLFRGIPTRLGFFMLIAALMLTVWYVSVVATVLAALYEGTLIGAPEPLTGWFGEKCATDSDLTQCQILGNIMTFGPFVILSSFFAGGWAERVADAADLSKNYIANEPTVPEEPGMRSKTAMRVREIYEQLADFDEIVVVGHSMGGAIAVDSLAERSNEELEKTVLVTWGTPLEVFARREPGFRTEVEKLGGKRLAAWRNYLLPLDYIATDGFLESVSRSVPKTSITLSAPKGALTRDEPRHERYYRSKDALEDLLLSLGSLKSVSPET